MKRIASLIMCLVMALSIFAVPIDSYAKTYKQQLLDKGFPKSYVDDLVELHEKYPNWVFKPFRTDLDWQSAVDGERSPRSNQMDGGYAASESTVKYYMDPRNWLDEKHIFQFESVKYNSSQTKSGIESIISTTWMKDSYIKYKTTELKDKTYYNSDGNKVKYSTAIKKAAENSGLSSYYLAAKIVQEVGSTTPSVGGTCGTREPFYGIYNYYSIGAYSTASDGLHWASGCMTAAKKTTLYSEYDSTNKKGTGDKTSVSAGHNMCYISSKGKYYKVRLYNKYSGTYTKGGAVGYILKEDCNTRYLNYGRPWTNPYKTIYYGAEFIADGYLKYQFTGYLQKFNVNKESPSLYGHEYMTNVNGAENAAAILYRAYKNASVIKSKKTFYIPVFKNMPASRCKKGEAESSERESYPDVIDSGDDENENAVKGLVLTKRTKTTLSYKWKKFSGATKYYIDIKNLTKGTTFDKTVTTNSATLRNLSPGNKYRVRVKAYSSKKWRDYSKKSSRFTLPEKAKNLQVSSYGANSVKLKWNTVEDAVGYKIYSYNSAKKKYILRKTVKGVNKNSATVKNLISAAKYAFVVRAYVSDSKVKLGAKSNTATVRLKPGKVTLKSLSSPSATKIKAVWTSADGFEDGYEIWYSRDKAFNNVVAKKIISSKKKTSYVGKNFTKGVTYYIKVRSYKKVGDSKKHSSWSNVKAVKSK
ncbi:MAG: fibronectin type III domain-containing protein [Eubacterium sp.]|nr:fibronectin type III domain-containing protein [Eubacterium sp.]